MSEKTTTLERTAKGAVKTEALPLRELLIILRTVFPTLRTIAQMLERIRVSSNNLAVIEIRGDKVSRMWSKNDSTVFPIVTFLESGSTLEALKVVAFWKTELARAHCIFLGAKIIPGTSFITIFAKVKNKSEKALDSIKHFGNKSGTKFLKRFRGVASYILIGSSFLTPTAPPVHLPPNDCPTIVQTLETNAKDWHNDLRLADLLSGSLLAMMEAEKKKQEKEQKKKRKRERGAKEED